MTDVRFDAGIAAVYDASTDGEFAPAVIERTVGVLAELAGDGAALELAIGTGRVALPLSQRGVPVHGIDESQPMVERLRAKPGGDAIPVTIGDMATTRLERTFGLVFLVYNGLTNLTTQDEQVTLFATVADHLEPGGRFVVENCIQELRRLPPGETIRAFKATASHLAFEEFDVATQVAYSHHYLIRDGRVRIFSAPYRHVWPSEMDLMARMAGLVLCDRWADWDRSPFTGESRSHVSVFEKRR